MTTLDISTLYQATGRAKRDSLPEYEAAAKAAIPPGDDATFTGPARSGSILPRNPCISSSSLKRTLEPALKPANLLP